MGYIDYESFQVPDWYWNVILNQYRKRYIKNYFIENGTYPSVEDVAAITLPTDYIDNAKQKYYIDYLIKEADKIDGDDVVPEIPEEPYIDVNFDNIAGYWEMTKWNGEYISDNYFQYIKFDKIGQSYVIIQTFDSFDDTPHVMTGYFYIDDKNNKPIIRGNYDYDGGDWPHWYYVTLTDTKMIWTAVDDTSITYEFTNKGIIWDKLIFGTYNIVNELGDVYTVLMENQTFELYQKLGEQTNYTKYTGTFELKYNKPHYYIDFTYSDGHSAGVWEFESNLPNKLVLSNEIKQEHQTWIRIDELPDDILTITNN